MSLGDVLVMSYPQYKDQCGTCLLEHGNQAPNCKECSGEVSRQPAVLLVPKCFEVQRPKVYREIYLSHIRDMEAAGRCVGTTSDRLTEILNE